MSELDDEPDIRQPVVDVVVAREVEQIRRGLKEITMLLIVMFLGIVVIIGTLRHWF